MLIYGAGLAGLLAGCTFQTATLCEAGPPGTVTHKALLRFRSSAVGDAVGIDFRKVRVHKGVWYRGDFHRARIDLANWYARKVTGVYTTRSIWDLAPVDRYIAPEDFPQQLIERCGSRLVYDTPITALVDQGEPIISTIPMNVMARMSGAPDAPEFRYAGITVHRFRLPAADLFQTVYFPDPATRVYRASVTGDLVIVEYAGATADGYPWWEALGLTQSDLLPLDSATQRYGKILPITEGWRQQFIFDLSTQHKIFSLGRFATWRNLLLDDLVHDLAVIKRLLVSSAYSRAKISVQHP